MPSNRSAEITRPARGSAREAIQLEGVWFAYGKNSVLRDLTLSVGEGEVVGLLGPNGCGKSTTLRLLTGALDPQRGSVEVWDRARRSYGRRELAQQVALVPQELQVTFDFLAQDLVMMGRAPYVHWLRGEREDDRAMTRRAMTDVGIRDLAQRPYRELSGGEKQRVVLAMALAQDAKILLLDEPTHNLDIRHQSGLFDLVRRINQDRGVTVLAVVHDINLASLYCDRVVLLRDGRVMEEGPPQEVITVENLRRCYDAEVHVFPHPQTGRPQVALAPRVDGSGLGAR
jgi:iron complex transport system ATP-binding protein